jgi:hypothetical protein
MADQNSSFLGGILGPMFGYGQQRPDLSYNDTSMAGRLAKYMTGRDFAQRAFYNDTRAGLANPAMAPEVGSPYGGLGFGLADRRQADMNQAQIIDYAVRSGLLRPMR